ncbi:MAG: Flp family type IVb pilin [Chloroflexi bacterium]|nr:Flp family type IVb pilin [Chloroflexota bacterium]MCL5110932.1 Flp family type IVb pilin [Chloroflexota bacterium]
MYLWLLAQSYLAMPRRQEGQGLVEYALIIVLVAVLIIVALLALKNQVSGTFSTIVSGLSQ